MLLNVQFAFIGNSVSVKSFAFKQRSERCGRLTADVAAKTAEILNAKIDAGKDYKGVFPVQKSVSYCGECHQTKGNEANWAKGTMDCTPCHSGAKGTMNKFKDHP